MSEIRTFKDFENRVHEELFNNLYLLKCIYPTSLKFDRVFRKDMFVKNNKAAFYEVVYYLLNTLNPELTKEKLTAWPPFEIKEENKLRNEILKYINELNHLYKHANIPPMMQSHLILPGGLKFTKFMLKLSQLVIYEHLKKKHNGLLLYCPVTSNKNANVTRVMLNNLNKITFEVLNRTASKIKDFQEYHNNSINTATLIINNLTELDERISYTKKEHACAEEEFYNKYTLYQSTNSLKPKLTVLKEQWNNLLRVHALFEECKDLFYHLSGSNLIVQHTFETSNTSQENELDLPDFLCALGSLLNKKSLELPNMSSSYIVQSSELVKNVTNKYIQMQKNINDDKRQIQIRIEEMFESLKQINTLVMFQPNIEIQTGVCKDDSLGVKPFEDSPV